MSDVTETVLRVEGMSCGNCVNHVGAALRAVDGVVDVDVQLEAGRAVIRHRAEADIAMLVAAVREADYEVEVA